MTSYNDIGFVAKNRFIHIELFDDVLYLELSGLQQLNTFSLDDFLIIFFLIFFNFLLPLLNILLYVINKSYIAYIIWRWDLVEINTLKEWMRLQLLNWF